MYVCLCKRVSDHTIQQVVAEGARSWREVREQTGCATQCGKCACMGKSVTQDALAREMFGDPELAYAV
ncbi:(2Fe-2S)-binding protein [Halomonas sp. GXIMD04776]|uniref:(2Fe-2S)-binding protein n=1 Tax=Halomonas sp. GXIMD04776 TaxID=3415605 RepID=UPI003CAD5D6C